MNSASRKGMLAWLGGVVASVLLIVGGIAYVVIGASGRTEVRDTLKREQIVGTPDMKPGGIKADPTLGTLPSCDVAGKPVTNGDRAKCFASYMRIHALEATGGKPYAQMGRYLDAQGNDTSDEAKAAKVHAVADATTQKTTWKANLAANTAASAAGAKATSEVTEARRDAASDKRDADYAVAKEKCDALAGEAKDACVNAAKARFSQH